MAVTGAILGDIAGSRFEFYKPENLDYLHCPLFDENHEFTDDTVMVLDDGMFLGCQEQIDRKVVARKTLSSAMFSFGPIPWPALMTRSACVIGVSIGMPTVKS